MYNGVSGKASTHRILDGVRNLESDRSLRKYIVISFLSSSFIDLLRQMFPKRASLIIKAPIYHRDRGVASV